MTIREERRDGIVVVAPVGRVDSTTSGTLDERFGALVGGGERRIVVDFSGVDYISSAGLRVMLTLAKKLREKPSSLALCAMGDAVREVFTLAGFLPLFIVEPTRDAAIARVAGA